MKTDDKKRILVIGEPDSIWFKEFVINMLINDKYNIFIVYTRNKLRKYEKEYLNYGINILELDRNKYKPVKKMSLKIGSFLLLEKHILNTKFDIAINMFVNPFYLLTLLKMKIKYNTKIFAYFCGSDIIRASFCFRIFYKFILRYFNAIIFCNNNAYKSFKCKIFDEKVNNLYTIDLGNPTIQLINDYIKRKALNKEKEKFYIIIGYNGSSAQNHISIINSLINLDSEMKCKIKLIIPMTYSVNQSYVDEIKTEVDKLGIDCIIYTDFMEREEMAKMWVESDIMIYAQDTDGLSGSVVEALAAGNILLKANWINYDEFYNLGLEWVDFKNYNDLPELITNIIKNYKGKNFHNCEILKDKFLQIKSREKWQDLLNNA